MSPVQLGPGLLVQHGDEDIFVLVDDLHQVGVRLTEADEEGLEDAWVMQHLESQELELLDIPEEGQGIVDSHCS